MAKVVVMPKLGLTMTEGTVSKWLKKVGDTVTEGEPLFEVETDKLTNTIEASASGVLRHLFVEEGITVPVLDKVAIIAEAAEDISGLLGGSAPAAAPEAPAAAEQPARRGELRRAVQRDFQALSLRSERRILRPLVRKERQQHLLDRVSVFMTPAIQLHLSLSRVFTPALRPSFTGGNGVWK